MHRQFSRLLFILLCIVLTFDTYAQNEAPGHALNGEFFKEWLVLGPFLPNNLDEDFLFNVGGEINIDAKEGDAVVTAQGDTLRWKRFCTNHSNIDLLDAIGPYENATAYAFCDINVDVDCQSQILVGIDDGVGVWINGKKVFNHPVTRWLFLDNDAFEADLKKGINRCLVKVSQGVLGWSFAMRAFPAYESISAIP